MRNDPFCFWDYRCWENKYNDEKPLFFGLCRNLFCMVWKFLCEWEIFDMSKDAEYDGVAVSIGNDYCFERIFGICYRDIALKNTTGLWPVVFLEAHKGVFYSL